MNHRGLIDIQEEFEIFAGYERYDMAFIYPMCDHKSNITYLTAMMDYVSQTDKL